MPIPIQALQLFLLPSCGTSLAYWAFSHSIHFLWKSYTFSYTRDLEKIYLGILTDLLVCNTPGYGIMFLMASCIYEYVYSLASAWTDGVILLVFCIYEFIQRWPVPREYEYYNQKKKRYEPYSLTPKEVEILSIIFLTIWIKFQQFLKTDAINRIA